MDINARLNRLNARRRGLDRILEYSDAVRREAIAKAQVEESWQRRAVNQPMTRYALGAMQEVDPESTQISLREALRVGKQLQDGVASAGGSLALELQGSVPLNVHIRGFSDVDLLALDGSFYTYEVGGPLHVAGRYTSPTPRTSLEVLRGLRQTAEQVLRNAFPAAKVDCSGSKAIAISGGSLARKVDVVPSHWHDTKAYQTSGQKPDRAVTILDTSGPRTLDNLPFLHIKRVTDRCNSSLGGLRKSIRMVKTVRADAEEEGKRIPLPSFDLAALMYHANLVALAVGSNRELAILAETQRHLNALATNHAYAKTLRVPDDSRTIFDSDSKLQALNRLSEEVDELVGSIALEQNRLTAAMYPDLANRRKLVEAAHVP